ncbi:52 kDa repressor of the inhibitor of the protein kinase-like [Athalia rosae]|uniref:52 kDa repressor of the inhibitor of the protein kinase-like n=1 Tax=Athalia rosae TaxID=37344 RepID=UPI0020346894|nr:52 kDa repressor of the inhibitor of the protein kinase-like [Athalia rosae]XP_048513026.1 52 kDa repressor of the inhibitor of the protein kinase-like [Athalia rosae]
MGKKGSTWCSATGCKNDFKTTRKSFFRFPKDPARWLIWVHDIGRLDLLKKGPEYANRNCKLCGDHFEERMYLNDLKTRLMPAAIPTLRVQGVLTELVQFRHNENAMPMDPTLESELLDADPDLPDHKPNILDIENCATTTGVQPPSFVAVYIPMKRELRHDLRFERAQMAHLQNDDPLK